MQGTQEGHRSVNVPLFVASADRGVIALHGIYTFPITRRRELHSTGSSRYELLRTTRLGAKPAGVEDRLSRVTSCEVVSPVTFPTPPPPSFLLPRWKLKPYSVTAAVV